MEQTNKTRKRISFIDVAKALALFAVCLSHNAGGDLIVTSVDSFAIATFFFLSGFTLKRKEDDNFSIYFFRKLKGYIFPLFWMNVLILLIQICFILGTHQASQLTLNFFLGEWTSFLGQYRRHALWFITTLFFSVLVCYPMMKYDFNKHWLRILYLFIPLVLAFLYNRYIHIWLHWNLDNVPLGVFFTYFGYLFAHLPYKKEIFFSNKISSLLLGAFFFAECILLSFVQREVFHTSISFYLEDYGKFPLSILEGLLGSVGITLISYAMDNPILASIGQANLVTLAIQQELIMRLLRNYILRDYWIKINQQSNPDSLARVYFGLVGACASWIVGWILYQAIIHSPLAFTVNKKRVPLHKEEEPIAQD